MKSLRYTYRRKRGVIKTQALLDLIGSTIKVVDPLFTKCFGEKVVDNLTEEDIIIPILANIELPGTTTVYKNGTTKKQVIGSTRSAEDLYLICKHYLPKTSFSNVLKVLDKLNRENILVIDFCITHRKYMFSIVPGAVVYRPVFNSNLSPISNLF